MNREHNTNIPDTTITIIINSIIYYNLIKLIPSLTIISPRMSSDKRSFGCVEYTIIIALCAILGFILYASLQYNPRETHTSITSQPSQTTKTSKVLHQPSSNPSIGNKMGHVKGATMDSRLGAAITKSTTKPSHHSIRYVPIHLHKGMRYVPIRLTPEGQEAD